MLQSIWEFIRDFHILSILSLWYAYGSIRSLIDFARYQKILSYNFERLRSSYMGTVKAYINAPTYLSTPPPPNPLGEILEQYQHIKSVSYLRHLWRRMTFRNPLDIYPEPFRRFMDWL